MNHILCMLVQWISKMYPFHKSGIFLGCRYTLNDYISSPGVDLDQHMSLNPEQYGFRRSYSTDLALLKFYDRVSSALAAREHVVGVFMDLRVHLTRLIIQYFFLNLIIME